VKAGEIELGTLGLDAGASVLLRLSLADLEPGDELAVRGSATGLSVHLRAWARAEGHGYVDGGEGSAPPRLIRGGAANARWQDAERAGSPAADGAAAKARSRWGLAARGAKVEAGGPEFAFRLDEKDEIWSDNAGLLYRSAAAAQWDPETAIPWDAERSHPTFVEDALVQVLTYLIENETAALIVPAKFCAQVHPHFREIQQLLAIQAADEARHIEVFTRRASLDRAELGLSTVGGQASLQTLVDEPDFAMASFLLSVLGEGSFLNLLAFLHDHAPDRCTAEIMRLVGADEARHVAFGISHLSRHAQQDPPLLGKLRHAIERRHDALRHTAGLNAEVHDALVLLAAGGLEPAAIQKGHAAVVELQQKMDAGRRSRLRRIGFGDDESARLSALHTRNFM
jgi:hypothetical protein